MTPLGHFTHFGMSVVLNQIRLAPSTAHFLSPVVEMDRKTPCNGYKGFSFVSLLAGGWRVGKRRSCASAKDDDTTQGLAVPHATFHTSLAIEPGATGVHTSSVVE